MDEEFAKPKSSSSERAFDSVVGHLEDIVVSDQFQAMQTSFMDKHYFDFEDTEENKLSYTPVFNEYVQMLEHFIQRELMMRIPGFQLAVFMRDLEKHRSEISEELFEMLVSLTDFLTFKQLMVDHRAFREGKVGDLSLGLIVTSLSGNQLYR